MFVSARLLALPQVHFIPLGLQFADKLFHIAIIDMYTEVFFIFVGKHLDV